MLNSWKEYYSHMILTNLHQLIKLKTDFLNLEEKKKRRVSYLYRTATTVYPCFIPDLGEFNRSWSYKTYPLQKYKKTLKLYN